MLIGLVSGSIPVIPGVQFDGPSSSGVILTNSNLTVTGTGSGSAAGARSLSLQSAGKFYFEVILIGTAPNATDDDGFGLIQSTATYTQFIGLTNLNQTAGLYSASSDVWAGGSFQDSFGGLWIVGDVGCCAVDLGAHLIWFRKNGGPWSLAGNPATGTGGITIQNALWTPVIAMQSARSDGLTGRFRTSSWGFPAPSGFVEWTP